jgi:flagellar basal body rod protein FlgG
MYTSAIGMRKGMQNLDVISNNIANANTTGFK